MPIPNAGTLLFGTDNPLYMSNVLELSDEDLIRLYNASKRLLARTSSHERLLITGGLGAIPEVEYQLVMPVIPRDQFETHCVRRNESVENALVRRILTHLIYLDPELGFQKAEQMAEQACTRLELLITA